LFVCYQIEIVAIILQFGKTAYNMAVSMDKVVRIF